MIRIMKYSDLAQCGVIYAKAFPIEHWGIDWTAENATDYLQDFLNKKNLLDTLTHSSLWVRRFFCFW